MRLRCLCLSLSLMSSAPTPNCWKTQLGFLGSHAEAAVSALQDRRDYSDLLLATRNIESPGANILRYSVRHTPLPQLGFRARSSAYRLDYVRYRIRSPLILKIMMVEYVKSDAINERPFISLFKNGGIDMAAPTGWIFEALCHGTIRYGRPLYVKPMKRTAAG